MKLRLGKVTFDSETRQLLRGASEIHLSPKAFDLLKLLVDHRPRVLSSGHHRRGRRGVLVVDGTVRGFTTGILVAASSAVVIRENVLTGNREGIFLSGSSANIVKENVAWQNGLRGIMIRPNLSGVQSTQNLVLENILIDNPSGILLFGQSGNTLTENTISGSTVAAIDLTGPGASGNLLKENRLASSSAGITFSPGWTGNRIIENQIEGNTCGLQGAAEGNTFEEYVFSANGLDWCS